MNIKARLCSASTGSCVDWRSMDTTEEVLAAAKKIGGDAWVIKAQVHAGGRGKAGGVKLVKLNRDQRVL